MSNDRVWLVTGCSTGLGRWLAEVLVASNQRAVLTARNPETVTRIAEANPSRTLALSLDVTDPAEREKVVQAAIREFGRIDVLVNNAGYGVGGAIEEATEAEIRPIFETNVFGLLALTQAVLPHMRAQRSGHILNLSSMAGMAATPGMGIYNATKFAVEGLSEALAQEVAPFGIRVTLVEPGPFRTDFAGRSLVRTREMREYDETPVANTRKYFDEISGRQPGDPERAARALLELVEMENPPLRFPMGKIAMTRIRGKLETVLAEIQRMEARALATDFPSGT